MAADVAKHLERAKKYLEKNKLQDAIEEYRAVLEAVPTSLEAMQALGDLHMRRNEPEKAAHYYGLLFDRLVESRDATKAAALYARFLKSYPQPPDRLARYAVLLQRQNKNEEAIEHYNAAAELHRAQGNELEALACWEKIAQLDPDNPARHLKLGEVGERLGKSGIAARGYLRAGQMAAAGGELDRALEFFERAHQLVPGDRSAALLYAEALLRKGDPGRAAQLLEPFPATEADSPFLEIFGEALLRNSQLGRARDVFEQFYREKPDNFEKLFEVASHFVKASQEKEGVELLSNLKERMFATKRGNEFIAQVDQVAAANPKSVLLAEFCGRLYEELNRESKYFGVLVRLFDLYLEAGNVSGAREALDRLVDIDPYDFSNQERMERLKGKVEPDYLRALGMRLRQAATVGGQPPSMTQLAPEAAPEPTGEAPRAGQLLDDMIVQAELFLQYSLQAKATEWLKKIAEMHPGEEEQNERLRNLYAQANWWPGGAKPKAAPAPAPAPARTSLTATAFGFQTAEGAETLRNLAKTSEIARNVYRQSTPKAVLSTAVNEIGKYLRVTRCLAVVGPQGQPPQMAAEYCAPGIEPAGSSQIVKLLAQLGQTAPDQLGGLRLEAAAAGVLREMGLEAALGVQFTDKETQAPAGMLVVGQATARRWSPSESYFLQAVGDQVLICVHHTKLRSLVRTLAVADEKTGLLGRSSYLDCLLSESSRARTQGTPLSLVIVQVDRGPELIREQGEALFERYIEQLARTLQSTVRQSDLAIKYTAWALAFILPDTPSANAQKLAEKLRKSSASVRPPWDQAQISLSAAVVAAVSRPDYESEDIVTDLINRAEFALEEVRNQGGDRIVSL